MTAEPLTAAEASVVARFDAAPPAEESAVEIVARAMWESWDMGRWDDCDECLRETYRTQAVVALAAMRPAPDTAKADEGAADVWERVWVMETEEELDEIDMAGLADDDGAVS